MFLSKKLLLAAAAAAVCLPASAVSYTVIGLGFEGLSNYDAGIDEIPNVKVADFYNGGYSKSVIDGSDVNLGPGFGVRFVNTALAMTSEVNQGSGPWDERWLDGANIAVDPPISGIGRSALWLSGDSVTINIPAGFNNALSFYYSTRGLAAFTSVKVFAQPNGVGEIASSPLSATGDCSAATPYAVCYWASFSIAIGQPGRSVTLTGNQGTTFFDNLTFGSTTPTDKSIEAPIPEPATYGLMALGLLAVAAVARRRRV